MPPLLVPTLISKKRNLSNTDAAATDQHSFTEHIIHIYNTTGEIEKARRHASVDFKVAPAFESLVTKYIARKLALESSHLRLSNECH